MSDARGQALGFRIVGWSAWADGLPGRTAFAEWLAGRRARHPKGERPACAAVPSMLRRRCTPLTRMVLEAALEACQESKAPPDSVRVVFCSRYGEVGILGELLEYLASRTPMSPKRFSNSVHHTATGYFDLATLNRLPSRTLSAQHDGLPLGFIEAIGFLRDHPGDPCLLVFADERAPEPFANETDDPEFPFAAALLLSAGDTTEGRRYCVRREVPEDDAPAPTDESKVFAFLRWLIGDDDELELQTVSGKWKWKR